jgi:hypothetical protein
MPTSLCGLQDLLAHLWWSHGAVEEFAYRVLVVDHRAQDVTSTPALSAVARGLPENVARGR